MMTHIKDLPKPINGVITLGEGCVIGDGWKTEKAQKFTDTTKGKLSLNSDTIKEFDYIARANNEEI